MRLCQDIPQACASSGPTVLKQHGAEQVTSNANNVRTLSCERSADNTIEPWLHAAIHDSAVARLNLHNTQPTDITTTIYRRHTFWWIPQMLP